MKTSADPRAGAEWALLKRVARNPDLPNTDPAVARAFVLLKSSFTSPTRRRFARELLLSGFDAAEALRHFCPLLPAKDAEAARKFLLS